MATDLRARTNSRFRRPVTESSPASHIGDAARPSRSWGSWNRPAPPRSADTGAITVCEDVNLEPAFWAQFPGNEGFVVPRALISSANMACYGPLHGFAPGSGHRERPRAQTARSAFRTAK
jgi:hypothetical protein